MKYYLHLSCTHPDWLEAIHHNDMIEADSKASVMKALALDNKQVCDMKNRGFTVWKDSNGVEHKLELLDEATIIQGDTDVTRASTTQSSKHTGIII